MNNNIVQFPNKNDGMLNTVNNNIVEFPKKNDMELHTITLMDWYTSKKRTEDEKFSCFMNIDKSMRYLHNNDYYVISFDPNNIELVDGSPELIRFKEFSKIENPYVKSDYIKEDIFLFTCLVVGLTLDILFKLDDNDLKNHFDEFAELLPPTYVPYIRGVIQRGASVYLCDFAVEKRNRDLKDLQKEFSEESNGISIEAPKALSEDEMCNKKVNEMIYRDDFATKKVKTFSEAAFINILLFPTIILGLGVAFSIISFILSLFA